MRRVAALAAWAALLVFPAAAAAQSPPPASNEVVAVAAWSIRSGDHGELPFAIVDKHAARVYVFGADGKLKGEAPVLIGQAVGDHAEPFKGDRELSSIPPPERTTPAGRFLAAWGNATKGRKVLWVDYPTAVSIHPLASVAEGEHREERMASPEPDDNRITFGCINVPPEFFETVIRPTFARAGIFYVLPETKPLKQAFPGFVPPPGLALAAR